MGSGSWWSKMISTRATVVRRLLESYRAQVTVAASAPEALELMRTGRMDVLLGEHRSSRHGWLRSHSELIRQAWRSDANIPAIALTAFARAEDRTRTLRAGFSARLAQAGGSNGTHRRRGSFLSLISSQRAP